MPHLKALTTEESLELLHCRMCAIESVLCEVFPGFFDEFKDMAQNAVTPNFSKAQKAKLEAVLSATKANYRGKK